MANTGVVSISITAPLISSSLYNYHYHVFTYQRSTWVSLPIRIPRNSEVNSKDRSEGLKALGTRSRARDKSDPFAKPFHGWVTSSSSSERQIGFPTLG